MGFYCTFCKINWKKMLPVFKLEFCVCFHVELCGVFRMPLLSAGYPLDSVDRRAITSNVPKWCLPGNSSTSFAYIC